MASDDRFTRWLPEGLRGDMLLEPPSGALRRAVALGASLGDRSPGWLTLLVFDSAASTLTAGVRRGPGGDRRLLYNVEATEPGSPAHQLDLQLRMGQDDRIELTGQLLPPWPGATVSTESGRRRLSKPLGPSGEFLFRRATTGNRTMTLRIEGADGRKLVLPDLRIATGTSNDS